MSVLVVHIRSVGMRVRDWFMHVSMGMRLASWIPWPMGVLMGLIVNV